MIYLSNISKQTLVSSFEFPAYRGRIILDTLRKETIMLIQFHKCVCYSESLYVSLTYEVISTLRRFASTNNY